MIQYSIGQIVPNFKGHAEGIHFDVDDGGATLIALFNSPETSEIDQFKSGKPFEIRFTELNNVIMITAKIGSLNWVDAPYTVHLSKNLSQFQIPAEGQGLGLTLILADTSTGEIKHIRLLGLSERFTRLLFGAMMEQKNTPFDRADYYKTLDKIFATYDTKQLVKISRAYCRM